MSSTLYPIARSFLQALNTFDFDAMAAQLHPSFQHNIWPTIMKFDEDCEAKQAQESGRKALTQKEIFVKQAKELREKVVEKWGMDLANIKNVVEGKDAVVVQVSSSGLMKSGKPLNLEYLFIFKFEDVTAEGGTLPAQQQRLIVGLEEWVDSKTAMEAFEVRPRVNHDGELEFSHRNGEKKGDQNGAMDRATAK